jgi:Tat protein translocase TatC
MARDHYDYSEDMFADTRMSFGEHLAELQMHLWRAIYGFLIALFFSFFIGKAVLHIIAAPVTSQLEAFYLKHAEQVERDLPTDAKLQEANRPRFVMMSVLRAQLQALLKGESPRKGLPPLPAEAESLPFAQLVERAQLDVLTASEAVEFGRWAELPPLADDLEQTGRFLKKASAVPDQYAKTVDDIAKQVAQDVGELRSAVEAEDAAKARTVLRHLNYALPLDAVPERAVVSIPVRIDDPILFFSRLNTAQGRVTGRFDLATLSVQEAFMAYFKVCIACGLVLGSPWIFYQIWLFIAAGLYPHEKRLVNVFLPFSVALFLAGVAICQVFVIPKAIEALLWFNQWVDMKPDLRFNEWLGFAIMMPVVFGISFQLPLVMYFLERIGVLTVESYLNQWKIAFFLIHVFAAVITPSVDIVSMELLALPMFGLYGLGILLCKMNPHKPGLDIDVPDSEEMVEV